jgi:DNA-binding NtrC family response regulator
MKTDLLLLAEDDIVMQCLMEETLMQAGFEVITVSTGTQAIAELQADANRFSGIITDVDLGVGPNGWEVGQHACNLVPDMPIVYASGNNEHEQTKKGVAHSIFLTKPYAPNQLVKAVKELLKGRCPPPSSRPGNSQFA